MSRVLKNKSNLITQRYKSGIHNGIDIVGENYTPDYIVAHSNGEVVGIRTTYQKTDKNGNSYGNYIKIKHDNGYYTLYSHLKYGSIKVKNGTRVLQGEILGYMGATGHATGVHLHFEVRNKKDVKIDPTLYIDADLPESKNIETETQPIIETVNDLTDDELLLLVRKTIRGDFGNGIKRKNKLGKNYSKVMQQVNKNYANKTLQWDKVKLYK